MSAESPTLEGKIEIINNAFKNGLLQEQELRQMADLSRDSSDGITISFLKEPTQQPIEPEPPLDYNQEEVIEKPQIINRDEKSYKGVHLEDSLWEVFEVLKSQSSISTPITYKLLTDKLGITTKAAEARMKRLKEALRTIGEGVESRVITTDTQKGFWLKSDSDDASESKPAIEEAQEDTIEVLPYLTPTEQNVYKFLVIKSRQGTSVSFDDIAEGLGISFKSAKSAFARMDSKVTSNGIAIARNKTEDKNVYWLKNEENMKKERITGWEMYELILNGQILPEDLAGGEGTKMRQLHGAVQKLLRDFGGRMPDLDELTLEVYGENTLDHRNSLTTIRTDLKERYLKHFSPKIEEVLTEPDNNIKTDEIVIDANEPSEDKLSTQQEVPAEPKTLKDFILQGKRLPENTFRSESATKKIYDAAIGKVLNGQSINARELSREIYGDEAESKLATVYNTLSIILKKYSTPKGTALKRGRKPKPFDARIESETSNKELEEEDEDDSSESEEIELERIDQDTAVDTLPTKSTTTTIDREIEIPDFDKRHEADIARAERELEAGVEVSPLRIIKHLRVAPNGYQMKLLPDDVKVYDNLVLGLTVDQISRLVHGDLPSSERKRRTLASVSRIGEQYSLANYVLALKMAPDGNDFSFEVKSKGMRPRKIEVTRAEIEAERPPNPTVAEASGLKPIIRYEPGNVNPYVKLEFNGRFTHDLLTDRNSIKVLQAYFNLRTTPSVDAVSRSFDILVGKDFYSSFNDLNELMAKKWNLCFVLQTNKQGEYLRIAPHLKEQKVLKLEPTTPVKIDSNPGFIVNHAPPKRAEVDDTTRYSMDELRERDRLDERHLEGDSRIHLWLEGFLLKGDFETLKKYAGVSASNPAPIADIPIDEARKLSNGIEHLGFRIIEVAPNGRVVSTYLKKLF